MQRIDVLDQELKACVGAGMSVKQISSKYCCSESTVYRRLREQGLKPKVAVDYDVLERLLKEGRSAQECADILGVCRHTVYRRMRKRGMKTVRRNLERDSEICQAYEQGVSTKDLAERYNIALSRVYQVIHEVRGLG